METLLITKDGLHKVLEHFMPTPARGDYELVEIERMRGGALGAILLDVEGGATLKFTFKEIDQ